MVDIEIAGPGKNALGTDVMRGLIERLREAAGRPVLLRGAGGAFSAGLDLREVARLDTAGMTDFLRLLDRLVWTLHTYPGPTVAAVGGHAIAGGCVLAVCCDHRVAAAGSGARIGFNEVALGVRFPPRVLAAIRARVPPAWWHEAILGAGLHDPAGALRLGLVDEIADDAEGTAHQQLARLAAHPPAAYAAAKADLHGVFTEASAEDERRLVEEVIPVWASHDVQGRLRAWLTR